MIYKQTSKIEKELTEIYERISFNPGNPDVKLVSVDPKWLLENLLSISRRLDKIEENQKIRKGTK